MFHVQNQVIENIKLGSGEGGSFEGLGEVLICAGFLLIYLIEELVHASCDKYAQHNHCPDDHTQTIKVHRFLFRLREKKGRFFKTHSASTGRLQFDSATVMRMRTMNTKDGT